MVLGKVLTQLSLPESLAKAIEEFAGIYRPPGYKKLIECLREARANDRFIVRGAWAIQKTTHWNEWKQYHVPNGTMVGNNWYLYLIWENLYHVSPYDDAGRGNRQLYSPLRID
tara:strand:- start:3065 stop:3403 length:339 start_codon:yes stop_codon:yes gene_type:complete